MPLERPPRTGIYMSAPRRPFMRGVALMEGGRGEGERDREKRKPGNERERKSEDETDRNRKGEEDSGEERQR